MIPIKINKITKFTFLKIYLGSCFMLNSNLKMQLLFSIKKPLAIDLVLCFLS